MKIKHKNTIVTIMFHFVTLLEYIFQKRFQLQFGYSFNFVFFFVISNIVPIV